MPPLWVYNHTTVVGRSRSHDRHAGLPHALHPSGDAQGN